MKIFGIMLAVFFVLVSVQMVSATNGCFPTDPECGSTPTNNCDMHQNTTFNQGVYILPEGIDICANNLVLDCNGALVNGTGVSQASGIILISIQGSTIKNCNVQGYSSGISISDSSTFNTLINNTANSNGVGIYLSRSNSSTLINNTANSNYFGISILYSSSNILTGNTANSNNDGIRLYYSSFNNLTGNIAGVNRFGIGLEYFSNSNILTGNIVNVNLYEGISIEYISTFNTLINNTANANTWGVVVRDSHSNILTGNTANANTKGIAITGFNSNNNTLTSNIADSNQQDGLYLGSSYSSANAVFSNRFCFNNESGGIYYDIHNYIPYGSPNFGGGNTCRTTVNWNDAGARGCTYRCMYSIVTRSIPGGVIGVPYLFPLEARGGIPPYTWSLNGTLPSGLEFHANGVLSGIPTQGGDFTFTVIATDSNASRAERTFTQQIFVTLPPPDIRIRKMGTAAVPGRDVDYFIVVENWGRFPAQNLRVTEFIEPWFTFVDSDPMPFNITNFTRASPQNINLSLWTAPLK